jgi:hypothetical protein
MNRFVSEVVAYFSDLLRQPEPVTVDEFMARYPTALHSELRPALEASAAFEAMAHELRHYASLAGKALDVSRSGTPAASEVGHSRFGDVGLPDYASSTAQYCLFEPVGGQEATERRQWAELLLGEPEP